MVYRGYYVNVFTTQGQQNEHEETAPNSVRLCSDLLRSVITRHGGHN